MSPPEKESARIRPRTQAPKQLTCRENLRGLPATQAVIVEFSLNGEQEELLAPLVRQASCSRRNILFLATAAPHNGAWRLQVIEVSPTTGSKILKLIQPEQL
jgi:hypothetical protein